MQETKVVEEPVGAGRVMLAQRRDHQGMVQGSLERPFSAWLVASPSFPIWTNLGYRRNWPSGARAAAKSVVRELVEKVPLAAARKRPDCLANHVPFQASGVLGYGSPIQPVAGARICSGKHDRDIERLMLGRGSGTAHRGTDHRASGIAGFAPHASPNLCHRRERVDSAAALRLMVARKRILGRQFWEQGKVAVARDQ